MKKMNIGSWIVGLIITAATAAVYLMSVHEMLDVAMCWICFGVILVLELVTTALFASAGDDPRMVARGTAFLLETVAVILISVVYILFFPDSYYGYGIFVVSLTALSAVAAVILTRSYASTTRAQAQVQNAKGNMRRCRSVVNLMLTTPGAEQYRGQLQALDEQMRFSNDSVITEVDDAIFAQLCALADGIRDGQEDVASLIRQIQGLLERRAFLTK